jgi:hypothetical protein
VNNDALVYKLAMEQLCMVLDDLIDQGFDQQGNPRIVPKEIVEKAREYLPSYCKSSSHNQ